MMHSYTYKASNTSIVTVLILVVMEDALAPLVDGREMTADESLNPCCNG